MNFVVRSEGPTQGLATAIHRTVGALDSGVPVIGPRSMDDVVEGTVSERRFLMLVLSLFAAVALILAGVGVYGVLSFVVAERTRKVRDPDGSRRRPQPRPALRRLARMVVVLTGLAAGLAASAATARVTASFLYGVAPFDAATLASVALTILAVSLAACLLPALRATRVDPAVTLRSE